MNNSLGLDCHELFFNHNVFTNNNTVGFRKPFYAIRKFMSPDEYSEIK